MSAVGAGVLVLGGATGVHAVQRDEPVRSPFELTAAGSRTAPEERGTGELVPFRIRLEGPGTGVMLAVATAPPWALKGVLCPMRVQSPVPVPRGVAVCRVGDLSARGGSIDVLLDVPAYARDIMVTAVARMRAPGGARVTQQARGIVRLPTARPIRPTQAQAPGQAQVQGQAPGQGRGAAVIPDTMDLTRPVGELRLMTADPARDMAPGAPSGAISGAPGAPGSPAGMVPGAPGTAGASGSPGGTVPGAPAVSSRPVPGAPGVPGATGPVATPSPGAGQAAVAPQNVTVVNVGEADQRVLVALLDAVAGRPVIPAPRPVTPAPRPAVPGAGAGATLRTPAPGAAAGAPSVPGVPGGRSTVSPVVPGGASKPGGGAPGAAPTPGGTTAGAPGTTAGRLGAPGTTAGRLGVPGMTGGMPGTAPAAGRQTVRTPVTPTAPRGRENPNNPVMGPGTAGGAVRGGAGRQRAIDPAGAVRRGPSRPAGPGRPGGGQKTTGRAGAHMPQTGPVVGRQSAGRPVFPGQGVPQGVPQSMLQQLGMPPQGMGAPMTGRQPGGSGRKAAGRQASGLAGGSMSGPAGPGHPAMGHPGIGQPGYGPGMTGFGQAMIGSGPAGQAGAGRSAGGAQIPGIQMPGAQMPGAQMPGMSPQGPQGPQGPQVPQQGQMPPMAMGMAGTLPMPGTADGSQFRLPAAGTLPGGQGSVPASAPQGAPLPQDLGAPDSRARPMAESHSSLTGIGGLPVVALAVATLLGLLWLQRRIQRRRRSRPVL